MLAAPMADRPVAGPEPDLEALRAKLEALGLRQRGGFRVESGRDALLLARFPGARSLILIGNVGPELWQASQAPIEALGGEHPLNDWVRSTLTPLAAEFGFAAVFDFDGPPYWPFQQWAKRAEGVGSSPLGALIHPEYGTWHAYRAAFIAACELPFVEAGPLERPCDTCAEKPCLSACPVGAFSAQGYDLDACTDHILGAGAECRSRGCLARLACPVGAQWAYLPDQASFHMRAFVAARRKARGTERR